MAVQHQVCTIEEFEHYIARPEHADRLFELINGEIVEKVPTEEHSLIAGNVYSALREFVKPRHLGRVAFEVRRQLPDDTLNARLPDVEFTSTERLQPIVRQGPVPQMPDLAVEVQSPNDSKVKLREKAVYYLKNGGHLVWLIFPKTQQVEVHSEETVQTFSLDDMFDGGEVLPGFTLLVKAIFEE